MKLPRDLRHGDPLSESYFRDLNRYAESTRPQVPTGDLLVTANSGGVVYDLARRPKRTAAAPPRQFPFQLYRYTPDPDTPAASDWRTFRVRHGFVNGVAPDNDDAADTPLNIIGTASTNLKIWLERDTETGAVTVDSGTAWPTQPEGDPDTGAPPDTLYIRLSDIELSDDTAKVATINQYVLHNLQVFTYASGWSWSDTEGAFVLLAFGYAAV